MKDEKITTAKTGEEWEKRQKQQEEQKQEQAENEREGKEQGQAEKQSREEKQPIVRPPVKRRKRKKKGKGLLIVCVLLLAAGLAGFAWYRNRQTTVASADVQAVQTASVTRMDITSELTASSSLAPKDTYEVTSLVEGEILAADFEEGDIVEKGVEIVSVTLHVGLGTFRPVKEENVLDHHMHSEHYQVSLEAAEKINRAREAGGRIICVGTLCEGDWG